MGIVNGSQIPDVIREKSVIMKHPTQWLESPFLPVVHLAVWLLHTHSITKNNKATILHLEVHLRVILTPT